MKRTQQLIGFVIAIGIWLLCRSALLAQSVSPAPELQSATSISTVDVVAVNTKTGMVLPNLSRDDFRLLDNGHEVPIVSFGSGAHYKVSPIALWLIVECNNFGPPDFTSAFMRGKTQFLQPGLATLDKADAVGVAHWCGDGTQAIDLPPSSNADAALTTLDNLLKRKNVEGANRQGEDAKRRMVEMILENSRNTTPRRVPVLLFLHGDSGYAFNVEANDILRELLATSGIVFGLNDGGYHFDQDAVFGGGRIYYEIHYLSQQTGGDFYGSPVPQVFAKGLDYILMQIHFRYTLGFTPRSFDAKEHDLKIELTPEGQQKYATARLRYRSQYIPVAPSPAALSKSLR